MKDLPDESSFSLQEEHPEFYSKNHIDSFFAINSDPRYFASGASVSPDMYKPATQKVVFRMGPYGTMHDVLEVCANFAPYTGKDLLTKPRADFDMSIRVHWGLWEPMAGEQVAGVTDGYLMAAYHGNYAKQRTEIPREEKSEKLAACKYYRMLQYGNPDVLALLGGTEWYVIEQESYRIGTPLECVRQCIEFMQSMGKR